MYDELSSSDHLFTDYKGQMIERPIVSFTFSQLYKCGP